MKFKLLAAILLLLSFHTVSAQEPSPSQVQFFETHIRPALVKYCYQCHSVDSGDVRGGLLLDTRQGWAQGGDGGPAIVPGKPDVSLFWEAINWDGYEMPPSQKMPSDVIDKFKQWIEMGAPDPREKQLLVHKTKISKADIEKGKQHWSFQSPMSRSDASIDSLIAVKQRQAGLKPAPLADEFTLLRRLNFDLVGLPPSPAEIIHFKDAWKLNADAAVAAKVDELLARTQFGERWGRHWLDVARYAESSGSRNVRYPHAWRYRNYVLDSFNNDTPYDRFIKEQVAGDVLLAATDQEWQNNLLGTGFLAIGLKHHDEKNPRKFMADVVDEQIDTMTQAVLGLTVACARCHDHKYDPIPTSDYYALAGIFHSTQTYYGTTRIGQNHRPGKLLLLPIPDKSSGPTAQGQQTIVRMQARIVEIDQQIRGVRGKDRRNLLNTKNRLLSQLASLNPDGTPKTFAMGVQDATEMVNANILINGEVDKPAQEVPRGFVQVLGDLNFTVIDGKTSGRIELANALTAKDNPLTARVMVNRIWMHLLGKPLVGTPSNFGVSGMRPDNQELLDYLAVQFMDNNWSVKSMIKEVVQSDAYRRSSQYNEANYLIDPDNRVLWRANPRQIDAEALRDSMLTMSGELNLERPEVASANGERPGSLALDAYDPHRSVYLPIIRDGLPAALDLFDFPDPNSTSAGRTDSIVPTQALYMMNSEFVTSQARLMAVSLESQYSTLNDQILYAFAWAFGRPPTDAEFQASNQFFREFIPSYPAVDAASNAPPAGSRPNRAGPRGRSSLAATAPTATPKNKTLAAFCQTLMASAQFRILN
ncbi:MAG TPA: DUF1553 domain-containing protein [Planctomycetes bacterium]|nr:DUF1553 domain-containing protein [Planctomycetaceae bacterium]HIN53658.1 DUF1553 domain-containing protein [Planctomycetota bacterium]